MLFLACITCALCAYIALTDFRQGFCHGSSRDTKYMLTLERNLACLAYGRALQARKQFCRCKRHYKYDYRRTDRLTDNVLDTRLAYLALQVKCQKLGYINVKRSAK